MDIEQKKYASKDKRSTDDLLEIKDFVSQHTYDARLNYSLWATEMTHKGTFQSEKDKTIWEYHSEGLSANQIAPIVGYDRSWIPRKLRQIKSYLESPLQTLSSASFAVA